jgi:hypothetical protein
MKDQEYHELLTKAWFSGQQNNPAVLALVKSIDHSIEFGDMERAVLLMKSLDTLDKDIPLEDEQVLDKGRLAAIDGETRSMDVGGNETKAGQIRRAMKKVPGGWVKEAKPAPHESISPKDTALHRK